jgi:ADP-heptose:LPS heptosyltransferase
MTSGAHMKWWSFLPRPVRFLAGHGRKHYRETGSLGAAIYYVRRLGIWKIKEHIRGKAILKTLQRSAKQVSAANVLALERSIPLICVKISGGVGDYLVIARFMRDLANNSEPFEFDIYCHNTDPIPWIFKSSPGFRKIYHGLLFDHLYRDYSLALRANQLVSVHAAPKWDALRDCPKLARTLDHIMRFQRTMDAIIDCHPYMDGFLGQKAVYTNRSRADFLHAMANIPYGGHSYSLETDPSVFNQLGLANKPYVTINNGFDAHFVLSFLVSVKRATKCYPHSSELVRQIKARYPGLTVVQIGASTSTPIEAADINVINKTSLQQVAALLKGAQLHVDAEGGLVHLAKCLGIQSCVIFGPTSLEYFAYSDNINIRPSFCGGCWWATETWMETCPRGFEEPRCMSEQKPSSILAEIEKAWKPQHAAAHLSVAGQ